MKNKILEYVKEYEAKKKSEGFYPTHVAFVDMQNDMVNEIKQNVNELIKGGKLKFTRVSKGIALYTDE